MRTIRFRGKGLISQEWLTGGFVRTGKGTSIVSSYIVEEFTGTSVIVYPETVGQFTGLLDKNGKEIYEGDILEMWLEDNVEPQGGYFYRMYAVFTSEIGFTLWGECMTMEDAEPLYELLQWKDCEVIGNVHDNHELLKRQ